MADGRLIIETGIDNSGFLQAFKIIDGSMNKMSKMKATPTVVVETSSSNSNIAKTQAQLASLGKTNAKPSVEADTASANANLARMQAQFVSLGKVKAKPSVSADTTDASSKTSKLQSLLRSISDKAHKVTVWAETSNAERGLSGIKEKAGSATLGVRGIAGAFGLVKVASMAMNTITQSMDGAISRFDTMERFPKVMSALGVSTEESNRSIQKLSDGIDGLPTTLDNVVSTAQRMASMTGNLDKATDATIALNNAFLASGSSTADASRGMEQYLQMMSRGEVDLQSWRSLVETMPVALQKVAEAFGITGESAQTELYDKLKEGEITFAEFQDKLIELGTGSGVLVDLAQESCKGIATSFQNLKTAVVKGLTGLVKKVDDSVRAFTGLGIADHINNLKGQINGFFEIFGNLVSAVVPYIFQFIGVLVKILEIVRPLLPLIISIAAAFLTWKIGSGINKGILGVIDSVGKLSKKIKELDGFSGVFKNIAKTASSFISKLTGLTVTVSGVGVAMGVAAAGIVALGMVLTRSSDIAGKAADSIKEVTKRTNEVKAANESVLTSIENKRASFKDESQQMMASGEQAKYLTSSLLRLVEAEGETATGKQKIATMVSTLNELVPGLNLAYDETTNSLSMANDEILQNIDNLIEQAKTVGYQQAITDEIKNQIDAQKQLYDTNNQLVTVQDELRKAEEELSQAQINNGDIVSGNTEKHDKLVSKVKQLKEQESGLIDQAGELQGNYVKTGESLEYYNEKLYGTADGYKSTVDTSMLSQQQMEIFNKKIAEGKDPLDAFKQAIADTGTTMEDTAKKAETAGQNTKTGWVQGINSGPTQDEIANSVFGKFIQAVKNLFGIHSPSTVFFGFASNILQGFLGGLSIPDWLNAGVQSIASFLSGFASGMPGVQGTLNTLGTIFNGGFQLIHGIVTGDQEQTRQAMLNIWNALPSPIQGILTTIYNTISGKLNEALAFVQGLKSSMLTAGQDMIRGLTSGIEEFLNDPIGKLEQLAKDLLERFKNALGIHSPSTEMRDIGINMVKGLINGLADSDLMKFVDNTVGWIKDAFSGGFLNIMELMGVLKDKAGQLMSEWGIIQTGGGLTGSGWSFPTDSRVVTDEFGYRESPGGIGSTYHQGLDIGAGMGEPIYAAAGGNVTMAGYYGGYGNAVIIDHGNGIETLYGHMSEVAVREGAVAQGQVIGYVGSTGNSTGPHLHFSVMVNGEMVDPRLFLGSFKVGTPYIPRDGYAYLHEGEAVLTKEENKLLNGISISALVQKAESAVIAEANRIAQKIMPTISVATAGGSGNTSYYTTYSINQPVSTPGEMFKECRIEERRRAFKE